MSNGRLTYDEAVSCILKKWKGAKIRDLCREYDVDPRRIYEVLEGKKHNGSLPKAYSLLEKESPGLAKQIDPSPRKPMLRVIPADDSNQGQLFS